MDRPPRRPNRGRPTQSRPTRRKGNWRDLTLAWLSLLTFYCAFGAVYPEYVVFGDPEMYAWLTFMWASILLGAWCLIAIPRLWRNRPAK